MIDVWLTLSQFNLSRWSKNRHRCQWTPFTCRLIVKIRFAKGRLKMSEPKKGRIKAIFKKEKKKKKKPEGSRHRGWKEWEAVSGAIHPLTLYASLLVGGGGGHSCIGNTHMSVFSFSRTTVGHDESTSSVNGRFSSVNAHHSAPIFAVVFVVFSLRFGFWFFWFLGFLKKFDLRRGDLCWWNHARRWRHGRRNGTFHAESA